MVRSFPAGHLKSEEQRYASARKVLALLWTYFKPTSVVDFGCGLGHWLEVCASNGVQEYHGYDGHHVDVKNLKIPELCFTQCNLEEYIEPFTKYDLAMSIEVGEHLAASSAENFVRSIVCSADVVLFSAAAPLQGGTSHVNEQPPSCWADLFLSFGYVCFDIFRKPLWNDPSVNCVHAQNILLYARNDKKFIFENQGLSSVVSPDLIYHPALYISRMNEFGCGEHGSKLVRSLKKRWKYVRNTFFAN